MGELGTVTEPLVYRLYGSCKHPYSMVLTENDLLDFLVAVVAENPGLPVDLKNLFKDKSFLFLGFGLSNCYLRILLHILELKKSEISSFALENPLFRKHKKRSNRDSMKAYFSMTNWVIKGSGCSISGLMSLFKSYTSVGRSDTPKEARKIISFNRRMNLPKKAQLFLFHMSKRMKSIS